MNEDPRDAQAGSAPAPPVVYLPVETDADGQVTDVKMVRLEDGRVVLLGYTALDRFLDSWGHAQPWMLFETRRLADIHAVKPFDLKLLDVAVPPGLRPDMARAPDAPHAEDGDTQPRQAQVAATHHQAQEVRP